MIKVFLPEDRDFTSNGEVVVKPFHALVCKVDNGDYYLDIEAPIDYAQYLVAGNIIVAPTKQGEQAFRISTQIEKTRTKVTLKAYHVFYDSEEYIIKDSYVQSKNCNDALVWLNSALDAPSPFTVSSNIPTIDSYRCVRKSFHDAIFEVIDRWGGHLVRDNFKIEVNASTGKDNGVTIQYRKNLKDIRVTENWSEVVTKILPVGKDGQLLPETYISSSVQYEVPYSKVVTFEQENISEESYPSHDAYIQALIADLREKATYYVNHACYPEINYTIEADVENITDTGDIVRVYDERLGVTLDASVISFEFNCLTGKYDKVEFGTLGKSLSGLMGNISSTISSSVSSIEQDWNSFLQASVEVAVSELWEALAEGYCIIQEDAIYFTEALPATSNTNVMRLDRTGISFSSTGINGLYTNVVNIGNYIDALNTDLRNLSLSSVNRGILTIGGTTDAEIVARNALGNAIATINANGITVKDKNVYDALFYSSGKTASITGDISSGYLSADGTKLIFKLPLDKSIDGTPSIASLLVNAYGTQGSIFTYSASGYDIMNDPDLTVTAEEKSNYLLVTIEASSPLGASSTPVSIEIVTASISFS